MFNFFFHFHHFSFLFFLLLVFFFFDSPSFIDISHSSFIVSFSHLVLYCLSYLFPLFILLAINFVRVQEDKHLVLCYIIYKFNSYFSTSLYFHFPLKHNKFFVGNASFYFIILFFSFFFFLRKKTLTTILCYSYAYSLTL